MAGGFDYMTQPTGPDIRVSLFGDAATAGTNVGNAIPTGVTAAIKGATEGIKTGLEINNQIQNAVIKQNQIDQQPIQNQLSAEELKAKVYDNQIRAIQAEALTTNRDTALQTAKAKAENELYTAQKAQQQFQQEKEIGSILGGGPSSKIDEAFSSKYAGYWADHPKDKQQQIIANWNKFSPELQKTLMPEFYGAAYDNYLSALSSGNAGAVALAKEIREANANPSVSSIQSILSQKTGQAANQIQAGSLVMVPADFYEMDEETGRTKFNKDGTPVINKAGGNSNDYSLYTPDGLFIKKLPADTGGASNKAAESYSIMQQSLRNQGFTIPQNLMIRGLPSEAQKFVNGTGGYAPAGGVTSAAQGGFTAAKVGVVPPDAPAAEVAKQNLQERAAAASPQVAAKVKSILESKQQTATATPTPTATPEPQKSASLLSAISDVLVAPAYADDVIVQKTDKEGKPVSYITNGRGQVVPVVEEKTVTTVKDNPLLANQHPLVQAVAAVESGGKSHAKSGTGVKGLLQVTQSVAKSYGLDRDVPEENVLAGKLYLRDLLKEFDGDMELTLAAYNGGPGRIRQAIRVVGSTDFKDVVEGLRHLKDKGVITKDKFKEIVQYPKKVLSYMQVFGEANG